jgi:regulator of protease activity HflC (stomatin/prohibitin superfamily)
MEIFWFITAFLFIVFLSGIRIVGQNTVLVIEFLGKFRRTMVAGLNYKIPLLERVAENVSLRQQNFAINGLYPSNDKVIIDVSTNLIFSVDSALDGVKKYVYSLTNRNQSIGAVIENSLRTYIAKETHEGILEKKEELAAHIRADVEKQFSEWGMVIYSFQITGVSFPATITQAMSEVVASEQLKKAAMNKGEATKIQAVKEAEGERERKRLQGEGIAMERAAIAEGLKESIDIVRSSTDQSSSEILALLTLTQYLDTLKTIGLTENSKVIFLDTNVNKTSELMQQLTSAMEISKEKKSAV